MTKVGDVLRIQYKGLRQYNSTNRGDMLLVVDLLVPEKISDEEREKIQELKKVMSKVATNKS
jgi:DnaJ-class molecular chaperone